MIGYHSGVLAYKIVNSGKPKYLARKLIQRKDGMNLRRGPNGLQIPNKSLSISKEGFLYRGASLLNKVGFKLRN